MPSAVFFFFFFFLNDIDVRKRYTGKVHPLKVGPSIVKRRRRRRRRREDFMGWVRVEGVCGCES